MLLKSCERYQSSFDRDLLIATPPEFKTYTRLFYSDREAFDRLAARAWDNKDIRTLLCLGRITEAHGDLARKSGPRLWHAWRLAGDAAQAHRLMTDRRYAGPMDRGYWTAMREVWVGLGRLDRAREVIETHLAPGGLTEEDKVALRAEKLERKLGPAPSWSETARLMELLGQLRLFERAGQVLQRFLTASPALSAKEAAEVVDACAQVFTFIPEAFAPGLLLQVAELFERGSPEGQMARAAVKRILAGAERRRPRIEQQSSPAARYCIANAYAAAGLHDPAIELLGQLTVEAPKDLRYRDALAYSVGERALRRAPLVLTERAGRKMFDIFSYNGERDVLAIRFAEMAGWVDHFVVVETRQTFTGAPKPALLLDCADLLARYGDKIIHVVEDEFPACMAAPWAREFHQRQRGVEALNGLLAGDDLVLISDADEIADGRTVRGFEGEFTALGMDYFRYYLNSRRTVRGERQAGTSVAVRGRYLARYGAALLRFTLAPSRKWAKLRDAGWHFTSIGDAERMVEKMQSACHQEYSHLGLEHYVDRIRQAREGRLKGWAPCSLDDLPSYVRDNREQLAAFLL